MRRFIAAFLIIGKRGLAQRHHQYSGKAVQHLCDKILHAIKGSILLTHTVIGMTLKTVTLKKLKIPTNTQIQYILPSSICMGL